MVAAHMANFNVLRFEAAYPNLDRVPWWGIGREDLQAILGFSAWTVCFDPIGGSIFAHQGDIAIHVGTHWRPRGRVEDCFAVSADALDNLDRFPLITVEAGESEITIAAGPTVIRVPREPADEAVHNMYAQIERETTACNPAFWGIVRANLDALADRGRAQPFVHVSPAIRRPGLASHRHGDLIWTTISPAKPEPRPDWTALRKGRPTFLGVRMPDGTMVQGKPVDLIPADDMDRYLMAIENGGSPIVDSDDSDATG